MLDINCFVVLFMLFARYGDLLANGCMPGQSMTGCLRLNDEGVYGGMTCNVIARRFV